MNLQSAKKFVEITVELEKQDKKIETKYDTNTKDLQLYKDLLEDTNKYFFTIIKNLKDTV